MSDIGKIITEAGITTEEVHQAGEIIARIVDPRYGVLQNIKIAEELKCYIEKEKWHLINRIKIENLMIAKEWVLAGYDIVSFIQIQDNGHDLEKALEILSILTILGRD